jgi:vesicle-associated membrane protein 7
MSDEQFPRRIAFAFLDDIKTRFMSMYRNTFKTAMAFGMNEEFSRVLQRQMVILFTSLSLSMCHLLRNN